MASQQEPQPHLLQMIKSDHDCTDLQTDLQTVFTWADWVNIYFNSDKFKCLRFWPGSGSPPVYQYKGPAGRDIEVKNDKKDLGIHISSHLTFKSCVEKAVTAEAKTS